MHDSLREGAVLSLRACAVVRPTEVDAYVCITPANIAKVHRDGAARLALCAPALPRTEPCSETSRLRARTDAQPVVAADSSSGAWAETSLATTSAAADEADIELGDDLAELAPHAGRTTDHHGAAALKRTTLQGGSPRQVGRHPFSAPARPCHGGAPPNPMDDMPEAAPPASVPAVRRPADQQLRVEARGPARRKLPSMTAQLQALARSKASGPAHSTGSARQRFAGADYASTLPGCNKPAKPHNDKEA